MCVCVYIYIYIEREREIVFVRMLCMAVCGWIGCDEYIGPCIFTCMYMYTCINIYS